ncbi:MAG TPA: amino acid adenylation domain-containing protein [Candidatus Angelobacter sp.]|nr:amino acid adenylation domain-containing protein [Candidatus Angelobacter sp.]
MSSGRAVLKKDRLEEERELLRRLLEKEGLTSGAQTTNGEAQEQTASSSEGSKGRPSIFPLSCQQEQLWFLDRFQPGSDFYNVFVTRVLKGDLDVPQMERSLQEVMWRHEILRTCFVVGEDEKPKQKVIEERLEMRLPVIDLRMLEADEREERAKKIVAEENSKPFDLNHAPLLRGLLVRTGEREYILALTLHHIICDEWSLGVLVEEFEKLYDAYGRGEESPLPELEMQYGDYALEQRERLREGKFQQQMEYWKKQLAGMPQVLELPADHVRAVQQSFRGRMQERGIANNVLESLNALGRAEGASLFMTLLAVLQVLLMRYTGQEDFGVGTSIVNRNQAKTHGLIGFFVNMLVMRANLSGDPTFREVLRQVRQTALSAYEHQDLPFDKLVDELASDRDISRNPLIQVVLSVNRSVDSQFKSIESSDFGSEVYSSKFDLTILVEDSKQAQIAFNYSTDLFEAETIGRMLDHFGQLLKAVVENPEQRVWELPLLTDQEKKQLENWSQRSKDYKCDRTVTELFEECAATMPNSAAVEYEGQRLTYEDLNRRANQLARYLRSVGVKPDARVAIGLERGLEMVVGMVAVLKAGGAYVPLDLSYPEERLRFILEDSAPVALLARNDLRGLPSVIDERVQIIDPGNEFMFEDMPETNLDRAETGVDPECLACVIYTSGSTGEPKGSEIPHRSIPGFFLKIDYVRFDEETVLLQHSSVSWDAMMLELWPALLRGGRSVLAYQRVLSAEDIRKYVQEAGVNTLWLTAAQFNAIVESDVRCLEGLKYLMTGGEAASVRYIRRVKEELPELRVVNGYGPSECTVFSSCYVVPEELPETMISLPIGKPIGDRRMYVLDVRMRAVPARVIGEAYIGGASVARGYLRRAELTAEKFVPDPYSEEGGGRLYRTGDLVRWRKDGTLEFIGRNDGQVKIRGFRIELTEIEAIVEQQSGVRGCAVVAKAGANGSKRLVAYVVGDRNHEELRRDLKGKLPAYMVPSVLVHLDELPLSSTGKVDRQALEKLEVSDFGREEEHYETPRTETEKRLAEIWTGLLEITRVGRHGNFFDLGGHSLLATSMVSRVQELFGVDVPVRVIFESPTLAELAEVIELELKSPGEKSEGTQTQIAAGSRPSLFPISFQQEQLWFLDRFQPSSDFYNVPLAWTLKGNLDVRRLERSLQEVVRRHEILRTCFVMGEDQEPKQKVVGEKLDVRLPVLDLRGLEAGEREEQARKFVAEEGSKAFDLSQAPLLRGVLVQMGDQEHVLGLTMHHIICDDWSLRILLRELGKLYEAYGKGEESPLPELRTQYGEYALEQRERLRQGKFQQHMDYWKEQLKEMPQVLELPTDYARPARQSFRGETAHRFLPIGLLNSLNALGREEKASLFMILMAVCQVLLMRYSGQEDFGVGTVVANRKRIQTEQLIGFFLNTLVIRANLGGEPTFLTVLRRVRAAALGGYEHQDLSFEKLVEELAPDRDVSRTPIFQVLFTSLGQADKLEFGDLELGGFAVDIGMSKFDLAMSVEEDGRGGAATINYTTDLFEAETIQRMLGHYEQLLKAVVENPAQRVWNLPLLTEPERKQLEQWNQTARDYPHDKTIAELFEEHAAKTPNTVAVEYEGQELKYGDLNRQANRLANYLRGLGVKPDTLVAVCVDRSLEMIVAVLAVMKAGGAYVPLDPAYPEERLQFMVEDSKPAVLLTQNHLRGLFTEINDLKVIDLGDAQAWSRQSDSNLENTEIGLTAQNLVYVIYTSGSTGMPKGVVMPVRGAMNMLAWQMSESAWAGSQRTLQFAALGFDVSFQEIFSTLCAGGTLVLIDEEKRRNSTDLTRYVVEKKIQRLFLPFVGLQMLADGVAQIGKGPFDCALQEINVAGEQLRIDDKIRGLFQRLQRCRLNNHYGPTETHAASAFHLGTESERWPLLPSIGQPISNAQIYILDKHEQFVPVGVVGELYIGGAGVARGYLNRPELEAKRFLKNRFAKEKGARMYRSGDLGRWRPDGTIEFIGRNDSQVKIRGYRVELGEIEAMLQQQSGVSGCAVVVKTGANGSKRLVAYVVGERNLEELRKDLKGKLPAYMIPSAIVGLQALPLSGNGKVDREALEKLEDVGPGTEHYQIPRTVVEEQLAEIWAETLGIARVGRNDNFFDLGGHSLLATLLVGRMGNTFGIHVPVRAIFESPTIAELAEVIESGLKLPGRKPEADKGVTPTRIAAASRPSLFPISYQQEQLWFLDKFNPGNAFYNIPMSWRIKGDLDVSLLERSLQEVVRRHEILRTRFVMDEHQEPKQKVVGEIDVRLPAMDLRMLEAGEREKQAKKVVEEAAGKAFDLGHAPLLRGVLVQTGDKEHVLVLTLHHIICDDWSLGVLIEELWKLYDAYGKGKESPLPELEMQYGDYALEQREWLRGGKFQQQMEYWKGELAGMPQVLELPTDYVRPARETFSGGTEQRILSSDLLEGLNALGRAEKASLLMTMLAAFQVLLMRYSGQEDFGVGTVVANRKRKETKGLIGFFLNTLVIRANLSGEPTFRDVLRRVRESVLSGYENQDLAFEKLVEDLAPNRDVSRSPVFQVAFTFLRRAAGKLELKGLELVPFELDPGTSKFDLILGVEEAGQRAAVSLNYARDLFEVETMQQMLQHYERLLEGIVADADQPIWALPMMSELDEKILASWSTASPLSHTESNISEVFNAQAEYRPQESAATFGATQLSYGELNSRANQVGNYLAGMGVAPESVVGIFLPQSQEMMVAILGVLKAGGAYLSLDVQNPKDRLRSIIESSGIEVLLTLEGLRKHLPQTSARVVCLDAEREMIDQQNATNPEVQINPQNLACVVYTTAAEKRAKGLMIEHRGLMDLVLPSKLSDSGQNGHARENIYPEIWSRLMSSSFLISNSAFLMSFTEGERTRFKPNGNAEIYILDPHLQRVAIGVPGELWMAGPAAGRGYLGQPSLAEEKFLPNPFTSEKGAHMRRSGERARYREDGTIELMGRLDDQVEIEGFKVELGEIEAALLNCESVQDVAVVLRPNSELVAYVVVRSGKRLGQNELHNYLDEKLPPYMIPSAFITLQELPRNAKGEVNRAALSVLGQEQLTREFVLPRTELEQTIATAWQAVLGVDQVGVHDNFFDLGGHSLLMIQLHQKLRASLAVDIELLHLFQFPTIDSLVRFLQAGYNFDVKSRETQDRAGKQKSAVQKFRRIQTP